MGAAETILAGYHVPTESKGEPRQANWANALCGVPGNGVTPDWAANETPSAGRVSLISIRSQRPRRFAAGGGALEDA